MNPQAQFSQTLNSSPQAVPAAFAPGSVALPQVPAAYQQYFNDQAGFAANTIAGNEASAKANVNDYNSQQAIKAKAQALTDRFNELAKFKDPSQYQQAPSKDGGFDFYDPSGNKITVQQYAQVTGKDPSAILKGSFNPTDRQHNADYQNMIKITDALYNNDTSALQKVIPQVFGDKANVDETLKQLKSINPYALYQSFVSHYPSIYGQQPQPGTSQQQLASAALYGGR